MSSTVFNLRFRRLVTIISLLFQMDNAMLLSNMFAFAEDFALFNNSCGHYKYGTLIGSV